MRYLLGLLAISAIIGGIARREQDPADAAKRAKEIDAMIAYNKAVDSAKEMILSILKDPDSAKFGNVFLGRQGTMCGTVNSKNGFGGYTGAQVFTIDTKYVRIGDGAVAKWNKNCATK